MNGTSILQLTVYATFLFIASECPTNAQLSDSIHLEFSCSVGSDRKADLFASLVNDGDSHSAIRVGMRLGNGLSYHSDSLSIEAIEVTDEGGASSTRFDYLPRPIGGRIDPWIVPLPAGARYSWVVAADQFSSEGLTRKLQDVELPVELVLHLEAYPIRDIAYREGLAGTLRSSVLRVPDDCRDDANQAFEGR